MKPSEGKFDYVHLRRIIESEWDSSELVQASKSGSVQLIICGSLIKVSANFKLSVQGFFFKMFFKKMKIISSLQKQN